MLVVQVSKTGKGSS